MLSLLPCSTDSGCLPCENEHRHIVVSLAMLTGKGNLSQTSTSHCTRHGQVGISCFSNTSKTNQPAGRPLLAKGWPVTHVGEVAVDSLNRRLFAVVGVHELHRYQLGRRETAGRGLQVKNARWDQHKKEVWDQQVSNRSPCPSMAGKLCTIITQRRPPRVCPETPSISVGIPTKTDHYS